MSRHLDGSPKPPDPLWYRRGWFLRLRCAAPCAHEGTFAVAALVAGSGVRQRLPADTRLWEVVARARCSRCGRRPPADAWVTRTADEPW